LRFGATDISTRLQNVTRPDGMADGASRRLSETIQDDYPGYTNLLDLGPALFQRKLEERRPRALHVLPLRFPLDLRHHRQLVLDPLGRLRPCPLDLFALREERLRLAPGRIRIARFDGTVDFIGRRAEPEVLADGLVKPVGHSRVG